MIIIKKIAAVFVVVCLLLVASYLIQLGVPEGPSNVELEMQSVEEELLARGDADKIQRLVDRGERAGELLEMTGTALTGNKPVFSFDRIQIRYYYIAYPCFDIIKSVDEKLGNYAAIEHVEDVNAYTQEQKDEILINWGNHIPEEEFLGQTRKFPLVIFYGSGTIEEDGVLREMGAIEDNKPGFVVVNSRATACCEKCLMFSACQSLTSPPDACEEYNYQIRDLGVDLSPTLPQE